MSSSKKVNDFRRNVMRGLTRKLGKSKGKTVDASSIKRILISRPNKRLGNLLLVTPLLSEIENTFPDCKVDIFVRGGLANVLFENFPQVDRIIELPGKPFKQLPAYLKTWLKLRRHAYDLIVNLQEDSSSGRLSVLFSRGSCKFFGETDASSEQHQGKIPVYNFRKYVHNMGITTNQNDVPVLDIRLSDSEKEHGRKLVRDIFNNDKPTLSIFTFATGSKMLDRDWWHESYEMLKKEYPEYNILEVLPMENVSQIDFACESFYSKDVREIAAVIAATKIFIGADSGIMHLASAAQTPILGLFAVTPPEKYEAYNNHSVSLSREDLQSPTRFDWVRKIIAANSSL